MSSFIHIQSTKFPILPEETKELINEGTYGKALAQYLQQHLIRRGYDIGFICCEDWGWWLEINNVPFVFGVCIYAKQGIIPPTEYVCCDSAIAKKQWSWKKWRFIDTSMEVERLKDHLMTIFQQDTDINVLGVFEDMPF